MSRVDAKRPEWLLTQEPSLRRSGPYSQLARCATILVAMRRMFVLLLSLILASGCKATPADNSPQALTIYTARDKDEVEHVIDLFTMKYPQYKGSVNTIRLSAQAALDRLRAEKSNPQAGFLWGGTLQGLEQAANEGLLAP